MVSISTVEPSHTSGTNSSLCQNNFMAYVRPTKDELDAFERLGNPDWNWDSLLKYMKKVSSHKRIMVCSWILCRSWWVE